MKRLFAVAILLGVTAFAEEKIPAGAVEVSPHTYAYTDAQGVKWTYRQTPFGMTKWKESDVPPPPVVKAPNPVKATDLGDSIRFERTTPMGHFVWTRKKSELSADEKALVAIAAASETSDTPKQDAPPPSRAANETEKK